LRLRRKTADEEFVVVLVIMVLVGPASGLVPLRGIRPAPNTV
jgi:hypothetical protein